MRISILLLALTLQASVVQASASPQDTAPGIGYIPAPSAKSAGRWAVVARLRQLGKEEFETGRENHEPDSGPMFEAKVLLDTSVFFSLQRQRSYDRPGLSTTGGIAPLLFEMRSGREYDIGRLYRVRDASGNALVVPLRRLIARRLAAADTTPAERLKVMDWVDADLARDRPDLFVTKDGIWAWPKVGGGAWLGEAVVTWAELRPYLDKAEAKRIGWVAP